MYLTEAQSGKQRAVGRMPKIHVGIVAANSDDECFGGFFDAFLSAC